MSDVKAQRPKCARTEYWVEALSYFDTIIRALDYAESESYRFDDPELIDLITEALQLAHQWVNQGDRIDASHKNIDVFLSTKGRIILDRLEDVLSDALARSEQVGAGRVQKNLRLAQKHLLQRAADILIGDNRFVKQYTTLRHSSKGDSMSDLKDQLIRLGSARPDLQADLRPILAELDKLAMIDVSQYSGDYYYGKVTDFNGVVRTLNSTFGKPSLYLNGEVIPPRDRRWMEPTPSNAQSLPRNTDDGWYWHSGSTLSLTQSNIGLGRSNSFGGDYDMLVEAGLL